MLQGIRKLVFLGPSAKAWIDFKSSRSEQYKMYALAFGCGWTTIFGVESGRGQNDTLRKLPLGVPVEPIGFFHQ
jgi:hypothetical protein